MLQIRPNRGEHLAKAAANRDFAYGLPKRNATEIGWAITALFYAALHYISGYLAEFHFYASNHGEMKREIARNPTLAPLFDDYATLLDYSFNARYRMRNYGPLEFSEAKQSFQRIEKHIRTLCV